MRRLPGWLIVVVGVLLVVFGMGCQNYTKADGWEHHTRVAEQHGLPPPSETIRYGGLLTIILGAGSIGYVIGRPARTLPRVAE